jgi:enoyl-CoA hydratase/carnithine racemase
MDFTEIAYEVEDRVLTITLDRPEKLNAGTGTMIRELLTAFDMADDDDDVRAIIMTGRGRAFCAGADLSSGSGSFDNRARGESIEQHRDGGGLLTLRIFDLRKPIIAAVNGAAVGMGVTMTLAMDMRLASDQARFGFVFARRGIVPEAASSWFLPRVVGIAKATEWVFSGRVFGAEEALDAGLVRSVHPADDLLPAAREIAREIAENTSAVSVGLSRQMLWRMLGASHPMEAHRVDSKGVYTLGQGADAREGVASFLEKRGPNFTLSAKRDMPDFVPWWQEPVFAQG